MSDGYGRTMAMATKKQTGIIKKEAPDRSPSNAQIIKSIL